MPGAYRTISNRLPKRYGRTCSYSNEGGGLGLSNCGKPPDSSRRDGEITGKLPWPYATRASLT